MLADEIFDAWHGIRKDSVVESIRERRRLTTSITTITSTSTTRVNSRVATASTSALPLKGGEDEEKIEKVGECNGKVGEDDNEVQRLAVVVPGGTGSTALFLARHLHPRGIQVMVKEIKGGGGESEN